MYEKKHTKKDPGKEFRRSLATWPELQSDSKSSLTKGLFKFQHVLLTWPFAGWHSQASHEFFIFTELHQSLSHTTLTLNLTINTGK